MTTTIDNSPKVTDTILFELQTTNSSGTVIDPYKLDKVVIQFLVRDFFAGNLNQLDATFGSQTVSTYYSHVDTIKVFGADDSPAWLSTDTDNAVVTRTDTGTFELTWQPEFAREGDYVVCWTWTPLIGDQPISDYQVFYLQADTAATTSIPSNRTDPEKYNTLLERYTPEFLKLRIFDGDLTPDVIHNFNSTLANGFTMLEDLANQIPDILDSNAVSEQLILYLSNTFGLKLRSTDVTRWRRQIKQAIPTFKRKGTLGGLTEALSQAGIIFQNITRLWQTVSKSTWQEGFKVAEDQSDFTLSKLAIISPFDTDNFELYIRPVNEQDYIQLTLDYVDFNNSDGVTTMTWVGDSLSVSPITLVEGDFIRVIYKIAEPSDQSVEDYIRTLPLADQRDETTITYPKKNWNVRLIAEDDSMFNTVIPQRHPFQPPIVYGKIRTEFPYSENIYNMDEYNGSTRDSNNPCHLDKDFVDTCSSCISSKFNIDIKIENLSDNRIGEAEDIIKDYVPFHAQVHQVNYTGTLTNFVLPPIETIECLVKINGNENFIMGQGQFYRSTTKDVLRNMLSDATVAASGSGLGTNDNIILYSPNIDFAIDSLGVADNKNFLEILSGANAGNYTVTNNSKTSLILNQSSPDSVSEPLDESVFTYRLSNKLLEVSANSITQDDLYLFSDINNQIRLNGVQPGWKIVVTGSYAGTYIISQSFPDDSISIASFGATSDVTNLSYQLKTNLNVSVGDSSTSGKVKVKRRGLINVGVSLSDYNVKEGDYALINGNQYLIIEVVDDNNLYVYNYADGDTGVIDVIFYKRLLDNKQGYLQYQGMTLTTVVNYESFLGIGNGTNGSGIVLEDSSAKENYLIMIGSDYYTLSEIDGTVMTLNGPKIDWTIAGTAVDFSIIHLTNQNITVGGTDFYVLDRRTNDTITYTVENSMSMSLAASSLNQYNKGQTFSPVYQSEKIRCTIEYRE